METLVAAFDAQLEHALNLGKNFRCEPRLVDNVVLAGLGGSAFGGEVVKNMLYGKLKTPFVVSRGYDLPAWVGSRTLVMLSSYSGNTEETLSAAEIAHKTGAACVCVTHGGRLADFARDRRLPVFVLPAGFPPRAAVAYSIVAQLYVLKNFGLIAEDDFLPSLREALDVLRERKVQSFALECAAALHDRVPVVYAPDPYESVAVRFRQQINENAKMLCWHHVLPEMNHNELVGWEHPKWLCEKTTTVFLRGADEHPRHAPRFDFTREVVVRKGARTLELVAVGNTLPARLFYLIHVCDWI
ncbi:MAG: bifunctional phosphoglucose/phosphomannose isomerase, partial [Bacteroidia bacterium]|nr:bifunctional phosphoglucose/phosphomannose isomerase [Bacteroidia bacterium]